ncbi:MAG TPA: CRTAC1 family protein [Gemmataceae bacterium]|nr:CRTAC1 family protein [Gemmataceae bacterium]
MPVRSWLPILSVLAAAAIGVLGCRERDHPQAATSSGPAWFEDVTDQVGLHFTHDAGLGGSYFLPEIMGSGAALFDCDNDGRLDIYLVQNGGPKSPARNRLFRQKEDGTFEDISAGSGLDVAGYGMGVAIADVNNDGLPDVLLTGFHGIRLFLNNGNCTFSEVTKEAGLNSVHWATSASFLDYDRDGWLDLVVVHYVDYHGGDPCMGPAYRRDYCHPNLFAGCAAQLFHNLGPKDGKIRFEDVTVKSGLARLPGAGLGVLCADFNGDGWPDIFVANDSHANHLWINQKNGTFHEEAIARGCAFNALGRPEANMGVAYGDVYSDGLPALLATHLTDETNTLWRQGPPGLFTDRTIASGLTAGSWRGTGFGVILADFNQDGNLDVAIVNGRVTRPGDSKSRGFDWNDYAERNQIFTGDGQGRFRDLSPDNPAFCETRRLGRGLCGGDIFGNGRVDLLASYAHGPARLYRNVAPQAGHWLLVRAILPEWKRDAYGATVTITAGARQWLRHIQPGSSYLCSNDPRAHFGLGSIDKLDSIRVNWPDGSVEEFPGCAADQRLTLRKGEGTPRR